MLLKISPLNVGNKTNTAVHNLLLKKIRHSTGLVQHKLYVILQLLYVLG